MNLSLNDKKLNTSAIRALMSLGVITKKYENTEYEHRYHPTHIVIDLEKMATVTEDDLMGVYGRGKKTAERAHEIIEAIDSFMFCGMNKYVKRNK